MMQPRAEMMWTQLFLLILAGMLLLVTLKPIATSIIQMTNVTSPTQKSFSHLNQEVEELLAQDRSFYYKEAVPVSIEGNYLLMGFDANYTPTRGFYQDYEEDIREEMASKLRGSEGLMKPSACEDKQACLCLYNLKEGVWEQCHSFGTDIVFAGTPFTNPHNNDGMNIKGSINTFAGWINDEWAWEYPLQNIGQSRRSWSSNRQPLTALDECGYDASWYEWYGYLALPGSFSYRKSDSGVSWKARNVYIEKLSDCGKDYLLLIPADTNFTEDMSGSVSGEDGLNLGESLVKERKQLLNNQYERIKGELNESIHDLNATLAKARNPEKMDELLSVCSRYRRLFDEMPSPCDQYDCRMPSEGCNSEEVPCICHDIPHAQVCTDQKPFCYTSGCTSAQRTDGFCG